MGGLVEFDRNDDGTILVEVYEATRSGHVRIHAKHPGCQVLFGLATVHAADLPVGQLS